MTERNDPNQFDPNCFSSNPALTGAVLVDMNGSTSQPFMLLTGPLDFESLQRNRHQSDSLKEETSHQASMDEDMTTQDRYIDARLAGIESKLDARMDAMQRFQEQAEQRFQRTTERHETDVALTRQQIHQEFKDARREMASESQANRKHSTQVAIGTIAGVLAAFALVVAVGVGWITEQGGYSDMQLDQQRAAQERAEFREAVQSIQQTQQSILERLPASPNSADQ